MPNTGILNNGGIMVNYQCNASCRHCLYSCSPTRGSGYINEETVGTICRLLRRGGCRSVHIGGGEPFINFENLLMIVRKLKNSGIALEYIETNAYWIVEESDPKKGTGYEKLKRLLAEGGDTLCISIDPYHAEYVPYGAPLALAKLCEEAGMNYFLWKQEFLPALSRLDSAKTHSRADLEKALSRDYIHTTAQRYGIGYGGRAINIESEFSTPRSAESFSGDKAPCRNLLSTGHFHVDMDGYFIPPRCTGIRIPLSEAIEGIPARKYLAFEALYNGGISALLNLARQRGFVPGSTELTVHGYPSKCNLCFHLRSFLSEEDFPELDKNHYEEALKYY